MIWICGILKLDGFQRGILSGRLVEMSVDTDVAHVLLRRGASAFKNQKRPRRHNDFRERASVEYRRGARAWPQPFEIRGIDAFLPRASGKAGNDSRTRIAEVKKHRQRGRKMSINDR